LGFGSLNQVEDVDVSPGIVDNNETLLWRWRERGRCGIESEARRSHNRGGLSPATESV
jgi:hypothetical protein